MTLTLNVITRNRPEILLGTVKKTVRNLSRPDTTYMVSIDEDDGPTVALADELRAIDPRIVINIKPREDAIGDKWSRALEVPAKMYVVQGDYRPFVTDGFDQKFLEAAVFPDGIGGVFGHLDNSSFPASMGITDGLVKKLGFLFTSVFPYWFVDHYMKDILELIDRIAFADVHSEYLVPKPPTQEQREVPFWATFFDCQRLVRRRQAAAIINDPDFQEPEWRKQLLLRHFPLVEYRSQAINDEVRHIFKNDTRDASDGGERYARVKERALAMMRELAPELFQEIGEAA